MVVKFTFQSVFGNSRRSPRHYSARGREESLELYSILWSDRPTSKQKVLSYGKSFCCSGSQTLFFGGREATTGNASAVRRLVRAIHLKSISSLLMLIQGKQLWYFTHFSIKQISPSHRFPDTNSVAYSTGDDNISYIRGTQWQFSGKYLFGRRFEIYNFRSFCCKISCLPASPRIFQHLQIGIITQF